VTTQEKARIDLRAVENYCEDSTASEICTEKHTESLWK